MRRKLLAPLAAVAMLAVAGCGGSSHKVARISAPPPVKSSIVIHAPAPSRLYAHASLLTGAVQGARYGGRPHAPGFGAPPPGDFGLKPSPSTALLSRTSSTGTVRGYDSVTATNIPLNAGAAGCYASDSRYANCTAVAARHPGHLVTIAIFVDGTYAKCIDVEPTLAVPSQAPGFVRFMHSRGVARPCVYADGYEWTMAGGVRAYLSAAGFRDGTNYVSWLADYDNNPTIPAGYDGKQFATGCCVDLDNWKLSFFPNGTSTPVPKPKPVSHDQQYGNYLHAPPTKGIAGGPFQSPYGSIDERWVVQQLDVAMGKQQSGLRLGFEANLRRDLTWLDARLLTVIQHSSQTVNASLDRYGRYDCMSDRAWGHRVLSWSQCFRWGRFHKVPA